MSFVIALHVVATCLLALFGAHRLWQLIDYLRRARAVPQRALLDDQGRARPTMVVQLPLFNERSVCERAVDAVARLDYPNGRLTIQVLDDSTDDTAALVAARVAWWRNRGVDVHHVRREARDGFKAGALAHGLTLTDAELVCVFDADFAPDRDFLLRLVPEFDDADVAMVQARWEHENRDESLLTRAQAACLDAHFTVEHAARSASERFFNFNGTAGIWRRRAIVDAGGWDARTLTEDLDLSLRAFLRGARFVYRDDVAARAELPAEVSAFLGQQHRWAKGSMQTARARLVDVWRAPRPLTEKVDLTLRLTQNAAFLWLALMGLTLPPTLSARSVEDVPWLAVADFAALALATFPVVLHLVISARARGRRVVDGLVDVPLAFLLGAALSIPNAVAVVAGFLDVGDRTFHRTPKRGAARRTPYPMRASLVAVASLVVAVAHLSTAIVVASSGRLSSLPMLLFFGVGLGWLSVRAGVEIVTSRAALSRRARVVVDLGPRRA